MSTTPPRGTLTLTQVWRHAGRVASIAEEIGVPYPQWINQCHAISLAILRTGRFGYGRIARGSCVGVPGQHSWIVLDKDVYNSKAIIVDPTMAHHVKDKRGIVADYACNLPHNPKGKGNIFHGPHRPTSCGDEPVTLVEPEGGWSGRARQFLRMVGPLDQRGWGSLFEGPMEGWPAAEIVQAALNTPGMSAWVPIDIKGMLTETNPGNLYW